MSAVLFWFRRDLRLHDNHGFYRALTSGMPVIPVFIFDQHIIDPLPDNDPRVQFIYKSLESMYQELREHHGTMVIKKGRPETIIQSLIDTYDISQVHTNHDYEPYAKQRDQNIHKLLAAQGIAFKTFKDHVIFEKDEVSKKDGNPYVVFTPYKNQWLSLVTPETFKGYPSENHLDQIYKEGSFDFPTYESLGFKPNNLKVKPYNLSLVGHYDETRDNPSADETTRLGPHLRFGTVSIRKMCQLGKEKNAVFLSELIWREFYAQILYRFPHVAEHSFRREYDQINWRNDEAEFQKWCEGKTGYPMVDAGMRQLNKSGFMHNRVRMITASFLVKHLLIDWRWGEAYFAGKLMDYELASNNGGWQWAAGSGTDAAPYFRIFNPTTQYQKFDPQSKYVKKWLKEDFGQITPMVDHKAARQRCLDTYKLALS